MGLVPAQLSDCDRADSLASAARCPSSNLPKRHRPPSSLRRLPWFPPLSPQSWYGTLIAKFAFAMNYMRPTRSNTSLPIILGALCLGILTAAVCVIAKPSLAKDKSDSIAELARPLVSAAKLWRESNPEGCPTIGSLVRSGTLGEDVTRFDPWGGTFRLVCKGGAEFSVVSSGSDGKLGTADDLEYPKREAVN